ncbi:dephospho-CoA kinase [Phenylobacterium sp.]|uniref:dephospho-CoA kinase n=1 Tax=Phenylobacterium sp. TaxID=1871053 RepID=UPI00262D1BEA|nr:dephospho-CoA kinase [Phenylobacterium sp.]
MQLIGLTGSIGMGKSTTAAMFREHGVPVYDADAAVHDLYDVGGAAVAPVGEAFPGVVQGGAVDRELLRQRVLGDPEALKRLNAIVHPLVGQDRLGFFAEAQARGADLVVLDIPLLFETGGDANMDAVVVVSAPARMQRERVLARPGMTPDRFDAILAQQMADAEKRARAHYVVDTGKGLDHARAQVAEILKALRAAPRPDAPTAAPAVEDSAKPGH